MIILTMKNVAICLFVIGLYQFLLHIYIQIVVFFQFFAKKLIFCGIPIVVFRVSSSGGVFLLSVSGKAMLFPAIQDICRFANFIRFN